MRKMTPTTRFSVTIVLSFLLIFNTTPELAFALSGQSPRTAIARAGDAPFTLENQSKAGLLIASNFDDMQGGKWNTVVGGEPEPQSPQQPPQSSPAPAPEPMPASEPTPTWGQPSPSAPAPAPPSAEPASAPAATSPASSLQPGEIARETIGPQGGQVQAPDGNTRINLPAGALNRNIPITISASSMEVEIDPEASFRAGDVIPACNSEFGPSGTSFEKPVTVTMQLSPEALDRIRGGHELVIAVATGEHTTQNKNYRIDDQGRVQFEMAHFTSPFLFTVAGIAIISFGVLFGRMFATDSPHIMIQPNNRSVQKFVRDGNVKLPKTINPTGPTDLGINKSYTGTLDYLKTINGGGTMVELPNGSKANCQDLSFLASSVLLASGDPRFQNIKGVGGKAAFSDYSGDHMWVEVNIDGRVYVVDTTNAKRLMLLPAAEAYKKYNLKPTFEFKNRSRRRDYIGWDGKPGADNFEQTGETPQPSSSPSSAVPAEPTDAQLSAAFDTGNEMGCRHMSTSMADIKAELAEVYGTYTHAKLKGRFRDGYAKGQARCRPN